MMSYKMWDTDVSDIVDGVDWGTDSTFEWQYKCLECVMSEYEVDARNALKLIYEQNGSWAYKQRKTAAFLKAQQEFKQVFGALGNNL